jgi:D-glucosaminate-6-phosphate ammonia-lyase
MRNSILRELGIRRAVNGKGTSTRLGGANLAPEVIAAMAEAAQVSIDAFDLQVAASRLVSDITGAEAGMVTTGASAGLLLAAAAAVAGLDVGAMNRLPNSPGSRNQILVPKSHRNFYDRALLMSGAELREVGMSDRVTGAGVRDVEAWEIDDAIDDRTAAIFYVATPRPITCVASLPLALILSCSAVARRSRAPRARGFCAAAVTWSPLPFCNRSIPTSISRTRVLARR